MVSTRHRLPVDPDVDALWELRPKRPLHLHARYMYVVFVGGMLGTLARYALEQWIPTINHWPWATLAANMIGAFLLGVLLETLFRRGTDKGWRRLARVHLGTGVLGSLTTYSSLATAVVIMVSEGRPWQGFAYIALTIILGAGLTLLGIVVATRRERRRA